MAIFGSLEVVENRLNPMVFIEVERVAQGREENVGRLA